MVTPRLQRLAETDYCLPVKAQCSRKSAELFFTTASNNRSSKKEWAADVSWFRVCHLQRFHTQRFARLVSQKADGPTEIVSS